MSSKIKRGKKLKTAAKNRRRIEKLKERAKSEWCEVQQSEIHGSGVYASKVIPAETQVIEYVGEKINKEESERRAWAQMAHADLTGDAAVYIFILTDKHDLDGNIEWNTARLLNHSCSPNCETYVTEKRVFIYALREIELGEELTFDYGFDLECWEDHPCLCGSDNCIGYIVRSEDWSALEEIKKNRGQELVKELV